jgi:hypothetical protein
MKFFNPSQTPPRFSGFKAGRIQDWSADSHVRAFLASDQVRADKAVRAPVFAFLESAVALQRTRIS